MHLLRSGTPQNRFVQSIVFARTDQSQACRSSKCKTNQVRVPWGFFFKDGRWRLIGTRSRRFLADVRRECRDDEGGGARETERFPFIFSAPILGLSTPRWSTQQLLMRRCIPAAVLWFVAFLGAFAQSLWGGRNDRAGAQAAVPHYVPSSTQRPETQGLVCVAACTQTTAAPASARVEYQQLDVASSHWIGALALACCSGRVFYSGCSRTRFPSKLNTTAAAASDCSHTTLSGNAKSV